MCVEGEGRKGLSENTLCSFHDGDQEKPHLALKEEREVIENLILL